MGNWIGFCTTQDPGPSLWGFLDLLVGVEVNVDVIWSIVYGFGVVISIIASAVVFSGSTSAFVLDWIQYCRLEATFQSEIVVCRVDCLFCMIRKIDFVYCAV